ncbi:hydrogenase maturation protein [Roseibium sp.]|uniref:hydrogenase maturation protein n=1 Tax=Roseibium sp. TaxID=1936156 RepID=UPI003A97B270
MRILLLCHSFNSLTQRLHVEPGRLGHELSVELDINDATAIEAVELFQPDLVLAPFLKRAIPDRIWRNHLCLVVHPGPPGDRGPSALDWAILKNVEAWGVTVLQADADMDAGPVWAWRKFPMRTATKSSLYRHEVTGAAVEAVLEALEKISSGRFVPLQSETLAAPCWQPAMRQNDRAIDWQQDDTATVLRKIAASDGSPGVRDSLFDTPVYLFNARRAEGLPEAKPGTPVARSGPAIGLATRDGAVWISHVRRAESQAIKLPATAVFAAEAESLPDYPDGDDIRYEEIGPAGFLYFPFYNGAMGTAACKRFLEAYTEALARPTRVLVLMGGPDHWSNGLDLNRIEAAPSAADESWTNINAMDDLAEAIIRTRDKLTVSAVGGNAGAGGVFLARAADLVWIRAGAVLNPHYKDMGNLYGSEFWTYLLPKACGQENAERIAAARLPMGADEALDLGLADRILTGDTEAFEAQVKADAVDLAESPDFAASLEQKIAARDLDEAEKPLEAYRAEELERMRKNFYGFDPSYHVARYNFVHKVPKSRTPLTLARHRASPPALQAPRRAAS